MRRFELLLSRLERATRWNYSAASESWSEPAALTALALIANGRLDAARPALAWLAARQSREGTIGVSAPQATPCWPTSLAVLAWQAWSEASGEAVYHGHVERGVAWTLAASGTTSPRRPGIGHDPTIPGWPWVIGTHSWLEPTALFVIALKRVGFGDHGRTRDAVRMLVDRLLPAGGCNFGNTEVLGQYLVPHVQPTGIVLTALAGEAGKDSRIERSLDFLKQHVQIPLGHIVAGLGRHRSGCPRPTGSCSGGPGRIPPPHRADRLYGRLMRTCRNGRGRCDGTHHHQFEGSLRSPWIIPFQPLSNRSLPLNRDSIAARC